jgi:hypothetical protein
MKTFCLLGITMLSLGQCPSAPAPETNRCWWCSWYPSLKPCPGCCDDYCAKPLPCVVPVKCCGPDDYCCKPLPSVCPVKCCDKDDYCPKPCPLVPRCWCPPWFICVPAAQGCDCRKP